MTLIENIITNAGLNYEEDLGLTTEDDYEELITLYVEAIKAWIDRYTRVAYTDETTYPVDLELIVYNIVIRILSNQSIQQDMPVIDNDNFKIIYNINQTITKEDRELLDPFKKKISVGMFILGQNTEETEDEDDIDDVV